MSNNNKNNQYFLSLKDLVNETLLRDLILFCLLFLFVLTQIWDNIILLLFPIITFVFSFFFRIICTNKWRIEFENNQIIYNPLGSEKKQADRLIFLTLIQLILLFWIGAESLYHPHIVADYYPYFAGLFVFSYTFGFFWMFLDFWNYTKIEIIPHNKNELIFQPKKDKLSRDIDNLISYLKLNIFKMMSIVNLSVFLLLNFLNLIFILVGDINYGIKLNLPGTGNDGSPPIVISFLIYFFLIISPSISIAFLYLNYKHINYINKEKLQQILHPLPQNIKIKIIEHLKVLDKNIKAQLANE